MKKILVFFTCITLTVIVGFIAIGIFLYHGLSPYEVCTQHITPDLLVGVFHRPTIEDSHTYIETKYKDQKWEKVRSLGHKGRSNEDVFINSIFYGNRKISLDQKKRICEYVARQSKVDGNNIIVFKSFSFDKGQTFKTDEAVQYLIPLDLTDQLKDKIDISKYTFKGKLLSLDNKNSQVEANFYLDYTYKFSDVELATMPGFHGDSVNAYFGQITVFFDFTEKKWKATDETIERILKNFKK